jgi:hypothetical protein
MPSYTLYTVLHPLDSDDSVHRQEPTSIKKMAKGESAWDRVKAIMGWIFNILDGTIYLPVRRLARIQEILASISATQRRVSLKKWQHVLGELRSLALAIPAVIDLFFVLQEALKTRDGHQV